MNILCYGQTSFNIDNFMGYMGGDWLGIEIGLLNL